MIGSLLKPITGVSQTPGYFVQALMRVFRL